MAVPFHTPYDGSQKPFTLALSPLDPGSWIEVDDRLGEQIKALDEDQMAYKELTEQHAAVIAALDRIAEQSS